MDKQGKAWGETTLIFSDQRVEVHYLRINKGGYCSEHKHAWKTNLFYIIEGKLLIRIWRKGEMTDETILGPGDSMIIPTHAWHQFIGVADCQCIEIYETGLWTADIERRTVGGKEYEKLSAKKQVRINDKILGKPSKQREDESTNEESLDPREEISSSNESH